MFYSKRGKKISRSYTLFFLFIIASYSSFELNVYVSEFNFQNDISNEVFKCLKKSVIRGAPESFTLAKLDVRQKNYEELLETTKMWRKVPLRTHTYKGYSGPWLEHYFYMHFIKYKDVGYFNGLIPVFVPWLDICALYRSQYKKELKRIFSHFRNDCLYFTVCQDDYGIERWAGMDLIPWNLLILSGIGNGNVAIPVHIHRQEPIKEFSNEIPLSFVGSETSSTRKTLFAKIRSKYPAFVSYQGKDWKDIVRKSLLNLVPRGIGITTFRLYEMIELGAIPVIVWENRTWIPYKGKLDYSKFSFIFNSNDVDGIVNLAKTITVEKVNEMRKNVLAVRDEYFTPEGNMKQIELFIKYGFSGSNHVCEEHFNGNKESIIDDARVEREKKMMNKH